MLKKISQVIKYILRIPRYPILFLIKIYQKTLSPDHGPLKKMYPHGYCRYYPSCSVYSYEVIKKHGLIVGLPRSAWRIMRCNPWSKGGIDLPD